MTQPPASTATLLTEKETVARADSTQTRLEAIFGHTNILFRPPDEYEAPRYRIMILFPDGCRVVTDRINEIYRETFSSAALPASWAACDGSRVANCIVLKARHLDDAFLQQLELHKDNIQALSNLIDPQAMAARAEIFDSWTPPGNHAAGVKKKQPFGVLGGASGIKM